MWLFGLFDFFEGVKAFLTEGLLLLAALACVAAGVALLSINVPILNWAKRGIAYVAFGLGILTLGIDVGYIWRGSHDNSRALEVALANERRIRAQREIDLHSTNEINAALNASIKEVERQRETAGDETLGYIEALAEKERKIEALSKRPAACPYVPDDRFDRDDVERLRKIYRRRTGSTPR